MKRSRCILRAFINELTQIMRAKFSLALSRHLSRYSRGPEMRREGRCDVTLMYRCAAPLMAYIWRVPPTRATLGYYESLINYANDLRTTTVYPSSSLSTLRRARTRNLDVTLLFVPPRPCPARSIALRRDASCCPFLSRIIFLSSSNSADPVGTVVY